MNETCTIFYSWQSDKKESRNFISDCLKRLSKRLEGMVLCDVDRDTQGLAGAPDIGDSIYEKIDSADVFIADVTIINSDYAGRRMPNPNVLIELGYAVKALGWDRIILLYDKDFGEIEELPFDINHRRIASFSLKDGEGKAGARDYVLSCITKTIEILQQEHRLYGGSAEAVKAQEALRQLLYTGLKRVWTAYAENEKSEQLGPYDQIPPVSEAQLALVEQAREVLTEEQYQLAHTILFHMKMSRLGNDDMYGWEFANQLVPQCFEALYIEFADRICELSVEEILQRPVIGLLNALSFEKPFIYEERRWRGGQMVFSTADEEYFACDAEGRILCRGRMEKDGFSGFKCAAERETEYEGEFVRGKKHGRGKEYGDADVMGEPRILLRDGRWEEDDFVEGRIYGVMAERKGGVPELVCSGDGGMVTRWDWEYELLRSDDETEYWFVDVELKDGDVSVVEGSMREVPKG